MDAWPESTGEALHTSTFLGNPLGCAMAVASMDIHARPETAAQVRAQGGKLREALRSISARAAGQVRGAGLMLGLELIDSRGAPNTPLAVATIRQALKEGLLLLADGPESTCWPSPRRSRSRTGRSSFAAARLQEYLTSLPGSIS